MEENKKYEIVEFLNEKDELDITISLDDDNVWFSKNKYHFFLKKIEVLFLYILKKIF